METLTGEKAGINSTQRLVLTGSEASFVSEPLFKPEIYSDESENFKFSKVRKWLTYGFWKWLVSPSFLLSSLLIYTFIPSKIFSKGIKKVFLYNLNNRLKRLFDILGAIVGLILCSIVFLILPVLIKLDSEGPVFYTQVRVGKNRRKNSRRKITADIYTERRNEDRRENNLYGRPFMIYKFRTMRDNAEKKCGPVWATKNDPRVTTLGRILRATHIDEIPQLINILKGDMSFVGPRPERPYFVAQFASEIPGYTERFEVEPGLTGLAQIKYGYDHSIESVKAKLEYDLDYCKNGTFYSYVKILLITAVKAILGKCEI